MKALLMTSGFTFICSLVGCSITESQSLKNDLCLAGLMCLFTLMWTAHLWGIAKEKKENNKQLK